MYGTGIRDAPPRAIDPSGATSAPASAFGETADPRLYVPRGASERVRIELEAALAAGRGPVALVSAPGLGKTLQLQLAAQRLGARWATAYLPYGALAFDELAAWVLGRLGGGWVESSPTEALRERALGGLLLLIDDADSLPRETARELAALATESAGGLRLALAASDDARGSRVLALFGTGLGILRLCEPMSLAETRDYVLGRVHAAALDDQARRHFDDAAIDRVHGLSAGIPRRVNELCAQLLEGGLPEDVEPSWRDQRWLGAPLDEV